MAIKSSNVMARVEPEVKEQAEAILAAVSSHGLAVRHILLTHVHFDHVQAAREVAAATGGDILAPEGDWAALSDPRLNLSGLFPGESPLTLQADGKLREGDVVEAGALQGDGDGLNISYDMLRILVVLDRLGRL